MNFKEVISKQVSFQSSAWGTLEKEISIGEVIKDIKNGKYSNEVNQLRLFLKNGFKDKYDSNKKRLAGVTFCANFDKVRKKESIKTYHKLIVIDIDKLESDELSRVKEILNNDKYVFTFWLSPSEKGFKGLIILEFEMEIEKYGVDISHKLAFEQLTKYFVNQYSIELDISGSDTTRLCFLSYDPELVFKTDFIAFSVNDKNDESASTLFELEKIDTSEKKEIKKQYISSRDVLSNPKGKNNQKNKKTIIKIINFLKSNSLSITTTYDEWYRVAYAIANSFTHDIGEKFFLSLCELDGAKYDEIQSKNMLLYCYQNSYGNIKFSTITFMAKNKGFKILGGGKST